MKKVYRPLFLFVILVAGLAIWVTTRALSPVIDQKIDTHAQTKSASSVIDQKTQYLEMIRRPLLRHLPENNIGYDKALQKHLQEDFEHDLPLLRILQPNLTDRELLVVYLVGRVHGSIPIYLPRSCQPNLTETLLFSPRGNCSDYALRTMLVCDIFDIATARFTFWTPSLPGHVLVEAYDQKNHNAYLLDSNYNIIVFLRNATKPGGVLLQLLNMSATERENFVQNENIIFMPHKIYYADPGFGHFSGKAINAADINLKQEILQKKWTSSLTTEFSQMINFLNELVASKKVAHYPLNLNQLREVTGLLPGYCFHTPLDTSVYHVIFNMNLHQHQSNTKKNNSKFFDVDCNNKFLDESLAGALLQ